MARLEGLLTPNERGRATNSEARPHQSNPRQRIDDLHSVIDPDLQAIGLSLLREVERWRASREQVDQVFAKIAREVVR